MNKIVSFGLAAAAVVAVVLIGSQLLGSPNNTGGPDVEPTATPSSTVEPTPSPTPVGLPEGSHAVTDGRPFDGFPTLPITVTISASGWYGEGGTTGGLGFLTKNVADIDPPDGAGMIVYFGELYVYGDPCAWATTRPDTPADTVDEIVAALEAQASRDSSEPVDITLDGYAGKAITLHVPDDAVFGECDGGLFGSWGLPGQDETPFRHQQAPGQIDEVWIVDVNGTLAIIDWTYYDGTPQTVVDELRAIVESARFGE